MPFKEVTQRIAEKVFLMYIDYFVRKKDHNTAGAALLATYATVHYQELYALREKLFVNSADALRYLVATKPSAVSMQKLIGF